MVSSLNNRPWLAFMEKLVGALFPAQGKQSSPSYFVAGWRNSQITWSQDDILLRKPGRSLSTTVCS